jgi:molybdate transport system substrate-binding protein
MVTAVIGLVGCAASGDARTELVVFASSSLTEAFRDLESAFEAEHPEVDVALTFAGSQVLRLQIEQGARADVFASANRSHIDALAEVGLARDGGVIARSPLVVIVPPDNPAGIETLADLVNAERIVIGTEHVPVGAYAREALERAGQRFAGDFERTVLARVVSQESNTRLVRAKVELGEADAAIVYRSDAEASSRVRSVPVPREIHPGGIYHIAVLAPGAEPSPPALAWIAFARSDTGRRILAARGFSVEQTPP